MDRLQSLYYKCFGNLPVSIEAITNSGSNKQCVHLSLTTFRKKKTSCTKDYSCQRRWYVLFADGLRKKKFV